MIVLPVDGLPAPPAWLTAMRPTDVVYPPNGERYACPCCRFLTLPERCASGRTTVRTTMMPSVYEGDPMGCCPLHKDG